MSDLFIKNIPSIKQREFKYRAKMSSHELNEMQDEAFEDILDLFNKANQLQKSIYEMNLANNIESTCYTKRLEEAISELNKIKEKFPKSKFYSHSRLETFNQCKTCCPMY